MKIAIIGSRELGESCYGHLCAAVPAEASEIVSGGAQGVDRLAERYAGENNLKMTVIRPDYDTYGGQAPLVRNAEIVSAADYVLVLWNGESRGSLHVIMTCMRTNKPFKALLIR